MNRATQPHRNHRLLAIAASIVLVVGGIVGVALLTGDDSDLPSPVVEAPDDSVAGAAPLEPSVEAFCIEYATLQGEQPASYVGSAEHLADVERLLAVAPAPVAGDLTVFRDYIASGAIDSAPDPESNLTENWPDDVQAAIANTQTFATDSC